MNSQAVTVIQEIAQALLALTLVVGALAITVIAMLRGQDPNDVPAWLTVALGGVLGWYFGARNSNSTIATLTNGPLHLVASLNQRAPQRSTDPPATPTAEAATA